MAKNVKKRNWTAVIYPESLPDNWKDILTETGLPIAISPLHDCDTDPNGEVKKEHYHIILCYDGPTTFNSVVTTLEPLNCPIPKPLESVRGMYRYFTHRDNPDKYQYDEKDIQVMGGFDISQYIELSRAEVGEIIKEIHSLIREKQFIELADLSDFLVDNEMLTQYNVLINHTYFIEKYLSSRRYMSAAYKREVEKSKFEKNEK